VKEIATKTLRRDFRSIDTSTSRVVLVEAAPRVLGTFPPRLSASAERQLVKLGIEVMTSTPVTDIDAHGVTTESGSVPAATVLWGAGVAASPIGREVTTETDRAGRVPVTAELTVADHPNVFVIGDLAAARSHGEPVPGVAPAAQQGGRHAARCIEADLAGAERPTFMYKDRGSLATIGRTKAVADLSPRLQFGGYFAWLIWWVVHIWSLVDFRSKLRAMSGWGWQYWTGRRNARLITGVQPGPVDKGTP
jgi:NADH dehydrogenase